MIAVANKEVKVPRLFTEEQRISYASELSRRPLPQPVGTSGGDASADGDKPRTGRRLPLQRTTLIPKRLKVAVAHPRLNRIYHELQDLKVAKFRNCCAVTFRVLLELSVDDFASRHNIPLSSPAAGRFGLRQKLGAIVDHLQAKSICTKPELRGVRALIARRDHFLSVDSLNAYVHNKDFNPTPDDLTTAWDNVETFVERIWTV